MMPRATILLLGSLASASADTLTLRNGATVTGTWLGVASGQIKFQVNDQIQAYPRSEVSTVAFGDAIPPSAPIPAPPPRSDASLEPPGNVEEPEKIGVVYFKNPTGKLVPLERVDRADSRQRTGRFGRYLYRYWALEGAKSLFRVQSGQEMLFVVSLANGIDPASFSLYSLRIDKNIRRPVVDPNSKAVTLTGQRSIL